MAITAIAAAVLGVRVLLHPPTAAHVLIFTTPLIVGVDRGLVIPLLRPSEAVGLVVGAALLARGLVGMATRRSLTVRFGRVDMAILLLAVTSSVLPLFWMFARSRTVTQDDLLYALTLWKYYGVYLIVRTSIRTTREVRRCLILSMAAASATAVVAVLQSLHLLGVPTLLATYYAPFGNDAALEINRGTSTLASSLATADVLSFNLAIALGWLARGARRRALLGCVAVLFVFGILGAGQFSGIIALVVGAGAVGLLTGRLTRGALASIPVLTTAGVVLQPVLQERLNRVDASRGLPSSWIARLDNLRRFFWPELTSDLNFLLGVRPSGRIAAPESWREYVYIESGHTWLLWNGGIPFFLAFFAFLWTSMRIVGRIARQRADAVGVAAIACYSALAVVGVLMAFDPHLTLRGTGDLLFALLALALTPAGDERPGASTEAGRMGTQGGPAQTVP
jgi:hypothetical protein